MIKKHLLFILILGLIVTSGVVIKTIYAKGNAANAHLISETKSQSDVQKNVSPTEPAQATTPVSSQNTQTLPQAPTAAVVGQQIAAERSARVCDRGSNGNAGCDSHVVIEPDGSPKASASPAGYGPLQFHGAYNVPAAVSASSTLPIIAIVDAYDHRNILNDLNKYSAQFGIPQLPACSGSITNSSAPCFQKVDQRGGSSYPAANAGWALEISLDVEVAHAMCQNCRILLVEADSNSFANLMSAVDRAVALGATVVSNSYGGSEFSGETAYDAHFNHPGVAVVVSSGDSGYGTEYPAASNAAVAVGGTTLLLNSDNSYKSETAWSGAGSGCSLYESKPLWQSDSGCATRTVADVSAVADPSTGAAVYDSVRYQGKSGWFKVGGTSLAAPIIAGVYALAGVPVATVAPSLLYASGSVSALHDVISGSNGSCGTYLCNASAGFDGPTGVGTPNGLGAF
ncbi:TPA: peptidase S8 [Candidatus Taylorbacteria bacterium]|nr:peptidase S8 [Candidatus Taylorbacteria bacterium]